MSTIVRRVSAILVALLVLSACNRATTDHGACTMAAAEPFIRYWFDAWELTSREILQLPDAPAPQIVFYDSACVYTNAPVSAHGATAQDGPRLLGEALTWFALPHDSTITLPNGDDVPVALMSFTSGSKETGSFFVMAAPSFWEPIVGPDATHYTGVFLHEFSHTRQLPAIGKALGELDSLWAFPEELNDDAVQTYFQSDSVYVKSYLQERDLLYLAADAATDDEARALATRALVMMRARHAHYFTGEYAQLMDAENIFLSMEGVGQFVAVLWLSHPDGAGMTRDAAVKKMLGGRRWWVQDHGLALLLVVDRLWPEWPSEVFSGSSLGATALLARAVE